MKFIVTTSPIIDNWTITEYLGPIISNEVLGVNFISDAIASLSDIFGGGSGEYREKLDKLKYNVVQDLSIQAKSLGADAIIGFNIVFNEISGKGKQMFMATASGTAVKLGQNRLEFVRKMHELKVYHDEGILSDVEYDHEISVLKGTMTNIVEIETKRSEDEKRKEETRLQKIEEERQAIIRYRAEEEEKKKKAIQEYRENHSEVLKVIEKEFVNHKSDISSLTANQILSSKYDDILPKGEISHYDVIRYFISIGRSDAAGKYYMDKFHLGPDDAIQYMSAI